MNRIIKWMLILTLVIFPLLQTGNAYATQSTKISNHTKKVAIIGGGMAGLAAATFLRDTSYQVYVFEAKEALGGHAQTQEVDNGFGKQVAVDLGPQYFSLNSPWDLYVEFLKMLHLYKSKETFPFETNATISHQEEAPHFVTPSLNKNKIKFLLSHIHEWRDLYAIYKLNEEIYYLYKKATKNCFLEGADYSLTVEQLLERIPGIGTKHKEEVLFPFLAGILGISKEEARDLSVLALGQLFAFNHPLKKKNFRVMKRGMGTLVQQIGQQLEEESENVIIKRASPVTKVIQSEDQFIIKYQHHGKTEHLKVDFVITAAHPMEVAKFFKHTFGKQDPLLHSLSKFEYITARIVLHHSPLLSRGKLSSMFNVEFNPEGITTTTLKLGEIKKKHYGLIHKSWVTDPEVYEQIKQDIVAESTFLHPLITPRFVTYRDQVREYLKKDARYRNISIAGGWTEITETQATAILSGYKAVYRLDPNLMKKKKWEKKLPSLKKICQFQDKS